MAVFLAAPGQEFPGGGTWETILDGGVGGFPIGGGQVVTNAGQLSDARAILNNDPLAPIGIGQQVTVGISVNHGAPIISAAVLGPIGVNQPLVIPGVVPLVPGNIVTWWVDVAFGPGNLWMTAAAIYTRTGATGPVRGIYPVTRQTHNFSDEVGMMYRRFFAAGTDQERLVTLPIPRAGTIRRLAATVDSNTLVGAGTLLSLTYKRNGLIHVPALAYVAGETGYKTNNPLEAVAAGDRLSLHAVTGGAGGSWEASESLQVEFA